MRKFEQSATAMSLKKQIAELRKQNDWQAQEIDELKKSTKVCVYNELDAQLEAYTEECSRLRSLIEQNLVTESYKEAEIRRFKIFLKKHKLKMGDPKVNDQTQEPHNEGEKQAMLPDLIRQDL